MFGSNKTKGPKQDSQNYLKSPIPEGYTWIYILLFSRDRYLCLYGGWSWTKLYNY